jgi:hypothetical protein
MGRGRSHRYFVMFAPLDVLLAAIVRRGTLTLTDWPGKVRRYGDGR